MSQAIVLNCFHSIKEMEYEYHHIVACSVIKFDVIPVADMRFLNYKNAKNLL